MSQRQSLVLAVLLLTLTTLACSIGGPAAQTEPISATPTETPTAMPAPTEVQLATFPPITPSTEPPTLLPAAPTAEQLTQQPSDTPTPTVTATLTRTLKPASSATRKPTVSAGPLTANYEVVEIKRLPNDDAALVLRVIATGGGGGYRYYNDNIQQAGATFEVPGKCGKPFVHTIKVTSADGQSVSLQYFVGGQCPTPTATPKS
jgi:hypothetical protein